MLSVKQLRSAMPGPPSAVKTLITRYQRSATHPVLCCH